MVGLFGSRERGALELVEGSDVEASPVSVADDIGEARSIGRHDEGGAGVREQRFRGKLRVEANGEIGSGRCGREPQDAHRERQRRNADDRPGKSASLVQDLVDVELFFPGHVPLNIVIWNVRSRLFWKQCGIENSTDRLIGLLRRPRVGGALEAGESERGPDGRRTFDAQSLPEEVVVARERLDEETVEGSCYQLGGSPRRLHSSSTIGLCAMIPRVTALPGRSMDGSCLALLFDLHLENHSSNTLDFCIRRFGFLDSDSRISREVMSLTD